MTTTGNDNGRPRAKVEDPLHHEELRQPPVPDRADRSVGKLLRDLTDDVATLLRKELALARSEVGSAVTDLKTGVGGVAGGGLVLYAGFLFLLASATLGLNRVLDAWLACLIVGGATALVGFILMKAAQQKLQPEHFRPDRTAHSLRKDSEMVQRRTS